MYDEPTWDAALRLTNLANKEYYASAHGSVDLITPRTAHPELSANYRFDPRAAPAHAGAAAYRAACLCAATGYCAQCTAQSVNGLSIRTNDMAGPRPPD